jgi:hypothetical protein
VIGILACLVAITPWPLRGATVDEAAVAFSLATTRIHQSNHDTLLVVATIVNRSNSTLNAWGLFDYLGHYEPAAATHDRWKASRDSLYAAGGTHPPRLPFFILLSRVEAGERLKKIRLAPRATQSDTLRVVLYPSDFERWPGFITVSGEFLSGHAPDTVGAVRMGRSDLRIAIPVP